MTEEDFNQYLKWPDTLIILLIYLLKKPLDKNLIGTLIYITE